MAGGLGGLGGYDFGSVLGALGQSLLTSPRENPFQGLPQALQNNAQTREHQAALLAMSTVAEKLGVPKELAASPQAMQLFIQHLNQTKLNQLRQQAAQGTSFLPGTDDATSQPALSVPGLQGSSGIPTNFNVAGGLGGGGGLGGPMASATSNTGLRAAVTRGKGSAPSARNLPSPDTARAIAASAERLGVNPIDLATVISYESAGSFSPAKYGGKGGKYLGLIQFGPSEQRQFGAHPGQTVEEQLQSAEKYLTTRGFKPGMGILDLYSTINAGKPGRYNASDAGNGGAPGTVADKVNYQMGTHRARALAMFNALGEGGAQTAVANVPLPPPRPTQLASSDPNMPLPSQAMQRVMDEAVAKGVGQGGAGTGQSGAPLNQVAASARTPTTPIQTTLPPAPVTSPPVGTGDTRTKAAARGEFQRGMNILATSNGDPVLMKQAEIIIQRAAKYLDPSDIARRVAEAGLTGTPLGRATIAGLDSTVLQALSEQQIPGYEAPARLEREKFRSAEEERAHQREFRERQFSNTIGQQTLDLNERQAARRQARDIATESHGIAQQSPAERLGRGLTGQNAAVVREGLTAETGQKAAEMAATTTAKSQATAQSTLPTAEAATSSAIEAIREIRNHPGRKWATGGTAIFSPYDIARPGGPTADFIALTKTLKGQLFRNAYETLKGEHGITDVEGEKATQAILNLDRTQSEGQFLKNLDTAEGILQKGLDTTRAKAGATQQAPKLSSGDIAQSLANARAAIQAGKPRDAVMEHLRANGIDPRGL